MKNENNLAEKVVDVALDINKFGIKANDIVSFPVPAQESTYDENNSYFLDVLRLEQALETEQYKVAQLTKDLDSAIKSLHRVSEFSVLTLKTENDHLRRTAQNNLDAANEIRVAYAGRMKTYAQIVLKLQAQVEEYKEALKLKNNS